ncbi:bacillithiol biosynthesis deacetylase BshB1 [Fictibacillus enclensis]|uniref:bacillithiol biosynthesis deacetylase BshB1 n=1 Tax=Fictibacillus enclensis TaxID=1017270 RepID=UPI0024BF395F|nr:bacillithiol biosynthesis deacetylase BshB1 [Fictibacillus enclensis]MDM5338734.1 bacillithiol biosynthesis deacetylase BshB1 [Fictibacillus enclensis]WHY70231.1 bacillithiol biosynthesis deacetylase BshB1 [Fictibacillus enclensis]
MKLESWLAFGAHSDDVEIGMSGSIATHTANGGRVTICDLTQAELSSNGTVERRKEEAKNAAAVLGVTERLNLGLPDRGLFLKEEYIASIVSVIRNVKPDSIFVPYPKDRHPDHGNCSKLVEEAAFSAGVNNVVDPDGLPSHRVKNIYFYFINGFHKPHLLVDISSVFEKKVAALNCYGSQFVKSDESFATPLVNGYIESVSAREKMFGFEAGVAYAEGFITKKPYLLKTL